MQTEPQGGPLLPGGCFSAVTLLRFPSLQYLRVLRGVVPVDLSAFIRAPVGRHLGCFQLFGKNEQSCYEHLPTDLCADICFHSSWVNTQEANCWAVVCDFLKQKTPGKLFHAHQPRMRVPVPPPLVNTCYCRPLILARLMACSLDLAVTPAWNPCFCPGSPTVVSLLPPKIGYMVCLYYFPFYYRKFPHTCKNRRV